MKDRIKKIRNELGMSQEKFGNVIGLKKNSMSQIESGINSPSEPTIKSICREFNVNEEWLRYGKGEMRKNRTRNQEISDFANNIMEDLDESFRKRLMVALSKLNESDWETIEKIVDLLIKEG